MYTIIDLHTDPSLGDSSRANAVVNVPTGALIVGDVWVKPFDTNPHHAVLWDRNKGKMIDLQDPTWSWKPDPTIGPSSLALSVNQKGGVVGSTVRPLGDDPLGHGFYCKYDPTAGSASKMVDLPGIQPPALAAYTSFARGINEKGVIVGHVQIEGFLELLVDQAVWWREIMLGSQQYLPTTLTTLPTVTGPGSRAAAINKNGTIVGRCDIDKQGNFHACRWDWDMTTDEPTKTNPPVELFPAKHKVLKQISSNPATFAEVWESYAQSYAWAISSDSKYVVGASGDDIQHSSNSHACVWRSGSTTGELLYTTNPNNPPQGIAYGVNSFGTIVGIYWGPTSADGTAFLYPDPSGGPDPVDLFSLLDANDPKSNKKDWTYLIGARSINDAGEIVGGGLDKNGKKHAFLMTPVVPKKYQLRPIPWFEWDPEKRRWGLNVRAIWKTILSIFRE